MKKRVLSMLLSLLLAAGILSAAAPAAQMVSMPGAYAKLLQEIRIGIEEKGFRDSLKYSHDAAGLNSMSDAAREYFRCKWSDSGQGGHDLTQTLWALRDLDGNGTPELLLSASERNLDVLYTIKNGRAAVVDSFEYRNNGEIYGSYVRQHGSGGAAYYSSHYYVFKGNELVRVDGWNSEYGLYKNLSGASITEAKANAIDDKYQTGAQPSWNRLCSGSRFVDVLPGDWYYDNVAWAVEQGVTVGTDRMIFSPEATCTRAQIVTFLWRAAGEPVPADRSVSFRDVAADAYYHDAVLWAVEQGITQGTGKNAFSPNADCTRAQVVTFLWRAALSPKQSGTNPFKDVSRSAYYYDAVLWAAANGVTSGMSATAFGPDKTCTRAQIAAFLYRSRNLSRPVTDAEYRMVVQRTRDAAELMQRVVLGGSDTDPSDSFVSGANSYSRVKTADTLRAMRDKFQTVFAASVVDEIMSGSRFVERNGKLYVAVPQYGGDGCSRCSVTVIKNSDTQFSVKLVADFGSHKTTDTRTLRLVNGAWVWDGYNQELIVGIYSGTQFVRVG